MSPWMTGIAPDHAAFWALTLAVVMAAWMAPIRLFRPALAAASLVIAVSWLSPMALAAAAAFVLPPWLAIRALWGRGDAAPARAIAASIAWEVALFVFLRGYGPISLGTLLSQPLAFVGLSYILFRVLHLLIEAPGSKGPAPGLGQYLLYLFTFWTFLSGPIQRWDHFTAGLAAAGRPNPDAALRAGHRIANGLIKTFLLAPLFLAPSAMTNLARPDAGWADLATVFYGYPIYLYLNFSGYTDFVIGIARLSGVNTLPENFDRPYLARNVQDFWARWHMSFGTWIKHYVFNPLTKWLLIRGGGRHANALTALSVMVTFVLVGLWHGPTAGFVIFGLLHGAGVIIVGVWRHALKAWLGKPLRKAYDNSLAVRAIAIALTFHFICATMAFFPNEPGEVVRILAAFAIAHL